MSIRTASMYVIAIPVQPTKQIQVGAKTAPQFTIKEATGEALKALIQTNDDSLAGSIIFEVKRKFKIAPRTVMELQEAESKEIPK